MHLSGVLKSFRTQYLARCTHYSRGDYTAETAVSGSISRPQAPVALRCHLPFLSGVLWTSTFGGTSVHADLGVGRQRPRPYESFRGYFGLRHAAHTPFRGTSCALGRLPHPSTLSESLRGYFCRLGRIDRARWSLQAGRVLSLSPSISLHTETSRSRGAAAAKFMRKSRRRRAYPQQIVTTRLLYCLQDPFAHLSRLQRI